MQRCAALLLGWAVACLSGRLAVSCTKILPDRRALKDPRVLDLGQDGRVTRESAEGGCSPGMRLHNYMV